MPARLHIVREGDEEPHLRSHPRVIPQADLEALTQKVAAATQVAPEACQPFRPRGAEDFYVGVAEGDLELVFEVTLTNGTKEYWRVSKTGIPAHLAGTPSGHLAFLRARSGNSPLDAATLARLLTQGALRIAVIAMGLIFGLTGFAKIVAADTLINSDITQNAHWTKAGSPYQVFTDETKAIVVYEKATLTIDPGVVVEFSHGSGLEVKGKLMAIGTKDELITFTSLHDQASEELGTPSPGDWYGLLVVGISASSNTFM